MNKLFGILILTFLTISCGGAHDELMCYRSAKKAIDNSITEPLPDRRFTFISLDTLNKKAYVVKTWGSFSSKVTSVDFIFEY